MYGCKTSHQNLINSFFSSNAACLERMEQNNSELHATHQTIICKFIWEFIFILATALDTHYEVL